MAVVCIDPGHGGHDPGAVGGGAKESDLALLIARRAKEQLVAAEHKVVWTRTDDTFVEIDARPKVAIAVDADLFVSLHCNAGAATARGVEALVVAGDARSKDVAKRVLAKLSALYPGLRLRGVKPDTSSHVRRLGVLRGSYKHMPAFLIECGFLTNEDDRCILQDPAFGLALGTAISRVL